MTMQDPADYELEEEWTELDEFPEYLVSNHGRFVNANTGHVMSLSKTRQGDLKVALSRDGRQYFRMAKLLVAIAFVPGRSALHDTPILKDGNQHNISAFNIAWRERAFAWRYTHQFKEYHTYYDTGPILEATEDVVYRSIADAGTINGELFEQIMFSCVNGEWVWPHRHIYRHMNDTHVLTDAEKTWNIMR